MLESHAQQGNQRYGVHPSDSALMTCLVFNFDKGEHFHFVDRSDGGFTAAAKNMKAQKRKRRAFSEGSLITEYPPLNKMGMMRLCYPKIWN